MNVESCKTLIKTIINMELEKYLCPEMTVYKLSLEGVLCDSGLNPRDNENEGVGYEQW